VRIERSSIERWLQAVGDGGRPLSPRNAWALIGLASGDQLFSERCVGLLEHPEELSRTRARASRRSLIDLVPRLRRRATLVVWQLPRRLRLALEHDAVLVRTGISSAGVYGWDELTHRVPTWSLDAYLPVEAFSALQEQLNRLDIDGDVEDASEGRDSVLLRVVNEPWPFPPHYPLAPQPLAALDLLDYPEPLARRVAREVLSALPETKPVVLARRSAKARALSGPLLGKLQGRVGRERIPRPVVEGDPRTDTRVAAAHVVGVLWASASQGVSTKELRAAVGLSRERLESAYEFLLEHPPLGLSVQRHGEEFSLVTAPEVHASIERHLGNPRPVALSRAALEVLAIIAYRQPIARAGIELIRGSASESALDTLLERGLIEHNTHRLLVTTRGFLEFAGLRNLADLPALGAVDSTDLTGPVSSRLG
jgi:segregation and condensation protein B